MRTPLTVIDTHLQAVRLSDGEQASASLAGAEEGVRRLQRTLDQMMTLARTEAAISEGGQVRFATRPLPPSSKCTSCAITQRCAVCST